MMNLTNLYKDITIKNTNKTQRFKPGSKTYRGVSTIDSATNSQLYDLALIKQDIINHFHIKQGEKLSDPTFGTILWDILFEPLTPQLRNLIIDNVNRIIRSDPRVKMASVIVDEYESGIQVECDLIYLPYNIQDKIRLAFDRKAGFLSS